MQGIILGEESFSLPVASANQSSKERFTAIKSLAPNWSCMWLPLTAKFSSFRTTVVNLVVFSVSEDFRF